MSNNDCNDKDAKKTSFIPLAEDDAVWIYKTDDPNDLVELVADPYEWVKRIKVGKDGEPKREAVLSDNFVISMDVSSTTDENASAEYVIDGIDNTGYIAVRMASPGGRFNFKSGIDFEKIEERILRKKPEFVFAQAAERCFVHLPVGDDRDIRTALLCAAIENQQWLCELYGKLPITFLNKEDQASGRKITFKTLTRSEKGQMLADQPKLDIVFQGSKAGVTAMDACNVGTGGLVEEIVYIDGVAVKVYAPAPGSGGG
jgi:hypothetical protein